MRHDAGMDRCVAAGVKRSFMAALTRIGRRGLRLRNLDSPPSEHSMPRERLGVESQELMRRSGSTDFVPDVAYAVIRGMFGRYSDCLLKRIPLTADGAADLWLSIRACHDLRMGQAFTAD